MRTAWGNRGVPNQTFFHDSSYSRKYDLMRLISYHWQFCISQYCNITKGLLQISRPTGSLGLAAGVLRAERGPGASSNVTELCFLKSKIDGENAAVWSEKWCDLQKRKKKGLLRNFNGFSGRNQVITDWNKTVYMRLRWAFHFSMSFGWAPSRAHGPPKLHGPWGHCPPLSDPCLAVPVAKCSGVVSLLTAAVAVGKLQVLN